MKKTTSLILALFILLASTLSLVSCGHECEFSEEWTSDGSHHWHVCANERCEEVADHGEHTWGEGTVTVKPTQEAEGTMTYVCSVCERTKNESIPFTGLDEEDWNKIFSDETFTNFTYSEEATVSAPGITATSTVIYKMTENKAYVSLTAAGKTNEETVTGQTAVATRKQLTQSVFDILKHGLFEYDAENKVYVLTGKMYIKSLNAYADSATLTFENGYPAQFVYTCQITSSGILMDCECTATFSDFGTTEIK